jgi:hypothetical protein
VSIREVRRQRGDPTTVAEIERPDFLARYWSYRAGDHVTVLGPTDCGKTHLTFELLDGAHRQTGIPPLFFATKPRDDLVAARGKELGYRRIKAWPPSIMDQARKPSGWLLWPPHTAEPDVDDALHYQVFRNAMLQNYKAGGRRRNPVSSIQVWDEGGSLAKYLGLEREQQTILKRGRSCKCGGWTQDQRAAWLPQETYNCAEHLFLAWDPDKRNVERYDDIGGFDPGLVRDVTKTLEKRAFLYLRRSDRTMCVIGP